MMGGGGGSIAGYGGSGDRDYGDFHAVASSLLQLKNLIDEAKGLGLIGGQHGGFISPVQSIQDGVGRLCAALEDVSRKLDVTAEALHSFIDSVERLGVMNPPRTAVETYTKEQPCEP